MAKFYLSQIVKEPIRITQTSSTIIDHVYVTDLGNIIQDFVPQYAISDHLPVCFTQKVNSKTPKHEHITTSYQCFKTFDETSFLENLNYDLYNLEINRKDIDEYFMKLLVRISKHLDKHAPIQLHRVKSSHLPDWYIPEIGQSRIARDKCKRLRKWADYKRRRNRTRYLICKVKCSHFTNSIENLKATNTMWKHLRANNGPDSSDYTLPEELVVDGSS